ncbi:MAG TPA: DUF1553 domain-containing protein [Bryobacteraceae bacterium]|nr:DUF1553 domain-containing protein [Bryobacteraceae bacterium]
MRSLPLICGVLCTLVPVCGADLSFNRDVRPILSDKCLHCHGTDAAAKKIALRLDSEQTAKADLGSGRKAVVPARPADSELIRRITSNAANRMPPPSSGLRLSPAEISTLTAWIQQGAAWEKHWAFVAPTAPDVPEGVHPVDFFVRKRSNAIGLEPSPEADRVTLLRRVSFDLTGLPPTPEEVVNFTSDKDPKAYEKVVDRLLASRRYGERMASRWLDAARYADTNGYQTDAERVMWPWRDWVIDAFNRNKPFDEFTVEQIAGDLLPNATLEQKIATGFNRNHRGNSEGGIVPEEYLVEYAVDRVETTSTVFLGMTLGCARCHNHKYDPFTQREFYSMLAYFNNVPELGRYLKFGNTPPLVSAPTVEQKQKLTHLDVALKRAEETFAAATRHIATEQKAWEATIPASQEWNVTDGLEAALPVIKDELVEEAENLGDKGDFGFFDKFTVAAFVRPRAADGALVSRARQTDDGEGWSVVLEGGKVQVNLIKRKLDDSIRVETRTDLALDRWQHVAVSYDGSRIAEGVAVYVDGKRQPVTVIVDAINQDFRTNEPLRAGGHVGAGKKYRGSVHSLRLYRRVMSPEEISIEAVPRRLGEVARMDAGQRTDGERAKLRRAFLEAGPNIAIRSAWADLAAAGRARTAYAETLPTVMVMAESPERKQTFILDRGLYDRPRAKVERGVPASLHPLSDAAPSDRLGFAKWLVDPANPLTARVTVNRFWQMYFGTGIVKTTEDFGSQGEWPQHPELLDWLATQFVRSGWDIKALQKLIVTSATYRQSSKVTPELLGRDPENRLLARGPRVRLAAEMIRDQALFASGLLVERVGGPSVKPYQPAGIWSELGDKDYERDRGEGLYRRSLYTYWKRTAAPPFMSTFDSALRESCTVRESRTNTPLQALNLMNDTTFVEAARVLAQRAIGAAATPDARIEYAFRRVLGRGPRAHETTRLRASFEHYKGRYVKSPADAEKLVSHGDTPRPAGVNSSELAAYTLVTSLLFNLDEAVTKE